MYKYSLLALSIALSLGSSVAADIDLAMQFPTHKDNIRAVTFASGESLASSRYSNVIIPSAQSVKLIFEGAGEVILPAEFSLDTVQFKNDEAFSQFLKEIGIKANHIQTIIVQNDKMGFMHSDKCKGSRSTCMMESEGIDFVIDYYNSAVRLFVSPQLLQQSSGEKSILRLNGDASLVNNLSVYYYNNIHKQSSPSYYLREQGRLGGGNGYVDYNTYFSDAQSQVNTLSYTRALMTDNKIRVGREQSGANFNASSAQSLLSNTSATGVRIGTASELVDSSYGQKRFRYYSPSSGTLEVRRNGELVYAIATQAGYGDINLANLPVGQYNADIQIKSPTGDIVSTQTVPINNTSSFDRDFSYHVFVGKSQSENEITSADERLMDVGAQFPLTPLSAVYLGTTVMGDDKAASVGFNVKHDLLTFTGKAGVGNNQFRYYEANAYRDNLSLSYRKSQSGEGWRGRQEKNNNESFSVNYNLNITSNLSLSTGYTYSSNLINTYNNDYLSQVLGQTHLVDTASTKSVFANLFYNFTNGSSFYLNGNKDLNQNNYSLSLGLSIPLSDNVHLSNTTYYDNSHQVRNSSTLNYRHNLTKTTSQTLSVGADIAKETSGSLSYGLSHYNTLLHGTGSVYLNNQGQKQLSFSGESTQVINSNGLNFVPYYSPDSAYVVRDKSANYDVSVRDLSDNSTRYFDADTPIMRVPTYHKLLISSNTEGSNQVFKDRYAKKTDMYTLVPGSSAVMAHKTFETNGVIVTVKKHNGEFAKSASCVSDDCISVSRLNNGVFKVKYTGAGFVMKADEEQCQVNPVSGQRFANVTCQ